MKRLKLTKERRERFLQALADIGNVAAAIGVAGTSRTRAYELRKADPAFATAWQEAEEIATDRLEDEARRRAVEGVAEPLVSAGKPGQHACIDRTRSDSIDAHTRLRGLEGGRLRQPDDRVFARGVN